MEVRVLAKGVTAGETALTNQIKTHKCMAADLEFKIGSDMIKGIVQEKLNTEVANALCGREQLVQSLVHNALNIKVNTEGKVSTYSYSTDISLIEWLCRDAIRSNAEKAIRAHFAEGGKGAALIQKAIEAELKAQTKSIAQGFVKSITDTAKSTYRLRAELKLEHQ